MAKVPEIIIKQTRTIATSSEVRLNGEQLLELIRENLRFSAIPHDATIEFEVPGGGDYSNEAIAVQDSAPIVIRWKTVTTDCG